MNHSVVCTTVIEGFRPPAWALSPQTCRQVVPTGTLSNYVLMTSHTCSVAMRVSLALSRGRRTSCPPCRASTDHRQAAGGARALTEIPSLIVLMRSGLDSLSTRWIETDYTACRVPLCWFLNPDYAKRLKDRNYCGETATSVLSGNSRPD